MRRRQPRLDFEGLYRSHRHEVYRVALRKLGDHHEAEDVTQSTFLDAYRAVLRGSEPDLPRAWLLAIAENVRRRRFRSSRRGPPQEPLRETLPVRTTDAVKADEIRAALGMLPASQRRAFLLRELSGLSYEEIAAELETSVPAVQMLLFRARQKLRRELSDPRAAGLGGLVSLPHWWGAAADKLLPTGPGAARVAGLAAAGAVALGGAGGSPAPEAAHGTPPVTVAPAARPDLGSRAPPTVAAPASATESRPAERRPVRHARAQQRDAEPVVPLSPPSTPEGTDGSSAPALAPASPPVQPVAEPVEASIAPVSTPPVPPVPDPPAAAAAMPPVDPPIEPPLPPLPPAPGDPGLVPPVVVVPPVPPVLPPVPPTIP